MRLRGYVPVLLLCAVSVGCGSSSDHRSEVTPTRTPTVTLCASAGGVACAGSPTPTIGPCTGSELTSCAVCATIGGCCTLTTPNGCFSPSAGPLGTLCSDNRAAACLLESTPTPGALSPTPTATIETTPTPTSNGSCVPAAVTPGVVTFVNNCAVSLTLLSNRQSIGTLSANGGQLPMAVSSFSQGDANVVMPYPNLSSEQCPDAYCDGWTDLGGAPGTEQREGFMCQGSNVTYAAYCNPNLSGQGICAAQKNCCGPNMVQDGTFGTTWEFTPNGANSLDYPDLSTNYGSGPMSPPHLCPYQPDPNDCVSAAANIFFNVPIRWSTNMLCSCTTAGTMVMCRQCLDVSCPDAYQHPTDDKQCACSSSSQRGYTVEFCPGGTALPAPPG